jgi:hypothetical protein
MDSDVLLLASDGAPEPPRGGGEPASGRIQVREFGYDRLVVDASVPENEAAWLSYADADHPGWKATVNGSPAPILRANLAFKAVALRPGHNRIEFRFWNGLGSALHYVLGAASVGSLVALVVGLLRSCRGGVPSGEDQHAFV